MPSSHAETYLAQAAEICCSIDPAKSRPQRHQGGASVPLMAECREILASRLKAELLWASPRELLSIVQAHALGCHIITLTNAMLAKLGGLGKDLDQFSLETVRMFEGDAKAAGHTITL